ncbi:MAG TPA: hypothetical protein VGA61_04805 [Anaerolineae bacterium]
MSSPTGSSALRIAPWSSARACPLFAAVAVLLALGGALLAPQAASANAAPPVPHLWFKLVYPEGKPGAIQAAQLVACADAGCTSKALVGQTGSCTAAGCAISSPAVATPVERFDCAEDYCLAGWTYQDPPERGTLLQLILQFPDGVRASASFPFGSPDYGLLRQEWQVAVTRSGLDLKVSPDSDGPAGPGLSVFLANLILTMVVELLVATLLWALLPGGKPRLFVLLAIVAGINLLTFPVVWLFFPSLTPYRSSVMRMGGCLSYVPLLYALAAYLVARVRGRRLRIVLIAGLVLSLPVAALVAWMMLFFSAYGEDLPPVTGLASGLALLLSEAFAVVGEAFLLRLFARRSLSWLRAGLISLLMNAASFGAGLAAAWLLPGRFV